tara:strand:- start:915 stop:1421 length:507 start_codon:yes stop_codon:yes gene_type:complete
MARIRNNPIMSIDDVEMLIQRRPTAEEFRRARESDDGAISIKSLMVVATPLTVIRHMLDNKETKTATEADECRDLYLELKKFPIDEDEPAILELEKAEYALATNLLAELGAKLFGMDRKAVEDALNDLLEEAKSDTWAEDGEAEEADESDSPEASAKEAKPETPPAED